MRPGKLFKFASSVRVYPVVIDKIHFGINLPANAIFMVISTIVPPELLGVVNYYDFDSPWLILYEEKKYLVDIKGKNLCDVTPFIDENGKPYTLDWMQYF